MLPASSPHSSCLCLVYAHPCKPAQQKALECECRGTHADRVVQLAEPNGRRAHRSHERVACRRCTKLRQPGMTQLDPNPSSDDNNLWVEQIDQVCHCYTDIACGELNNFMRRLV